MGVPDHITRLLRNLYTGQEATVKTRHGTTDWFKIGKGVCQGYILSLCLFNLYAEYIMWNIRLDDSQTRIKIARRKLEHFLTPYTKINSKWVKDLNVWPETIKLLEENIGSILTDINHSKIFYDPPPGVMEIKTIINKWDLIKLKSFCTTKKARSKVKRQPSEWEKITATATTEKELISKIYK